MYRSKEGFNRISNSRRLMRFTQEGCHRRTRVLRIWGRFKAQEIRLMNPMKRVEKSECSEQNQDAKINVSKSSKIKLQNIESASFLTKKLQTTVPMTSEYLAPYFFPQDKIF